MTTMTAQSTQVYQVFIGATPEQIWDAITTPDMTERFFYGSRIAIDPQHYSSHGPDGSVRGDIENRIKELHDLEIGRTSCTSFWANQFRVLLTATAYVLMQELRLRAAGTACARAQVGMLRERLLKLGARVLVSVRRVVVHLPASFPFLPTFHRVALALGAATG